LTKVYFCIILNLNIKTKESKMANWKKIGKWTAGTIIVAGMGFGGYKAYKYFDKLGDDSKDAKDRITNIENKVSDVEKDIDTLQINQYYFDNELDSLGAVIDSVGHVADSAMNVAKGADAKADSAIVIAKKAEKKADECCDCNKKDQKPETKPVEVPVAKDTVPATKPVVTPKPVVKQKPVARDTVVKEVVVIRNEQQPNGNIIVTATCRVSCQSVR